LHTTSRYEVLTDEVRNFKGVACRYVDPPLLINGLKSDLRLYVLVTSFEPLTVYIYHEGLARFATEKYDMDEIDNRCRHLTNYSLNKYSAKFAKNDGSQNDSISSKWSLSAYKRRMIDELGAERAARAWTDVDELIVKSLVVVEPTIQDAMEAHVPACGRREPNQQCFHLFGYDVMFDAQLKPWLIEVNLDPSMNIESPLDISIK
jgi:hypothetical protein